MDVERIIDENEQLQEMFELLAHSPWFHLWQHFGVCCRPDSPLLLLGKTEAQ